MPPKRGGKRGESLGDGLTLAQYAEAKQLDPGFLEGLGIREVRYSGARALEIPYHDANGELAATRYRLCLGKGAESDERFRWKRGSRPLPYGLPRLSEAREAGYVVLVEGESDCHVLWSHGIPALGIPGSGCWRNVSFRQWCSARLRGLLVGVRGMGWGAKRC